MTIQPFDVWASLAYMENEKFTTCFVATTTRPIPLRMLKGQSTEARTAAKGWKLPTPMISKVLSNKGLYTCCTRHIGTAAEHSNQEPFRHLHDWTVIPRYICSNCVKTRQLCMLTWTWLTIRLHPRILLTLSKIQGIAIWQQAPQRSQRILDVDHLPKTANH